MSERRRGIWYLSTVGRLSVGNMHQTAIINGYSSTTVPGQPPANFTGDLLAQRSNIGRYDRNVYATIPEIMVNLGVQITPMTRGHDRLFDDVHQSRRAGRQPDQPQRRSGPKSAAGRAPRPPLPGIRTPIGCKASTSASISRSERSGRPCSSRTPFRPTSTHLILYLFVAFSWPLLSPTRDRPPSRRRSGRTGPPRDSRSTSRK